MTLVLIRLSRIIQARRLNDVCPVPSKHSPHPPVPRTPNNTVPTLQKCPLSQELNHSPLKPNFAGFAGQNAQLKSGSRGGVGPRAGPTEFPCKIHMERVSFAKISACGEPESGQSRGEWGFSFCSLTAAGRGVPCRKNRCGQGRKSVPPLTISRRACTRLNFYTRLELNPFFALLRPRSGSE